MYIFLKHNKLAIVCHCFVVMFKILIHLWDWRFLGSINYLPRGVYSQKTTQKVKENRIPVWQSNITTQKTFNTQNKWSICTHTHHNERLSTRITTGYLNNIFFKSGIFVILLMYIISIFLRIKIFYRLDFYLHNIFPYSIKYLCYALWITSFERWHVDVEKLLLILCLPVPTCIDYNI